MNMKYTNAKEYQNSAVKVQMDRQLGSKHPKYDWSYPVNYGFVPDTLSPDGEELDAYVLGVDEPLESFEGICVAIVHRTNNNDDKLIVVPEGVELSDDEIRDATHFQEQYFESEIIK